MLVYAEGMGLKSGRAAIGRRLRWILSLASGVHLSATMAAGLGAVYLASLSTTSVAQTIAITIIGLTAISSLAALASRGRQTATADRLDVLRRALDTAADAQVIVAPNGQALYANPAFQRMFPGNEPPLDRIERSMAVDAVALVQFRRLRSLASAGVCGTEALSLPDPRSGAAGHFRMAANPIPGRRGYSLWDVRDDTARHKAEMIVRAERDKLVDFFDNAPIGFYSADSSGRFRFVNRTLAQWLDVTPSELLANGARLHDFLSSVPGAGTACSDPFSEPGNGTHRGEVLLKTRQGRVLPVWIGQSVVGSGTELCTRSVVCDLTPEREWKAALRLARRFQRFFANAPVGSALLDQSGRFEEANRALGELFGMEPKDLIGRKLIALVKAEDRHGIAAKLAATAEGQSEREPIEIRIARPRDKTIVLFLSRIDDGDDGSSALGPLSGGGFTLHFIDVTEQKNLEIQFAQSQKMQAIGQLAGGIAHDFNNLLTAMIGFCDLLLLRFQPGDPSFGDIMQIQQNANRAANLVRQLLAFSRQQTLHPRVLDITDVLVDLSHLLRRLIGENIELKVVHGRDLGRAKVDQGQLEQVIINLAVNARDAMPGGGRLTIRTANICRERAERRGHEVIPAGEYVLIEVIDTGVGIPHGNLERIFEPFFSTKEVGSGTGLGLSTVYGIVNQTGGFIFVNSEPGKGTRFEIYLPRHQTEDGPLTVRTEITEPAAGKDLTGSATVLLVEDEDPVRKFGARALRNKGYKVIEAESGAAALKVIRDEKERIDLVITDVVMPQLDGPALIREVRGIRSDMKVLFISGYAEDAFRKRLDRDSNIDFLSKPFNLKQLANKVKDIIGGSSG
jgi:two-component system cell cycle sensor histidine kinase/response regulator CckA